MRGVLIDTSVWIDFFNGVPSKEANLLSGYIESDYPIYICPIILQELLQGFSKDNDYAIAKNLLLAFPMLETNPIESAIGAADIYRTLRKLGKTIRKSNDCLIAYYAITHKLPILHRDRDFTVMAEQTKLKLVSA